MKKRILALLCCAFVFSGNAEESAKKKKENSSPIKKIYKIDEDYKLVIYLPAHVKGSCQESKNRLPAELVLEGTNQKALKARLHIGRNFASITLATMKNKLLLKSAPFIKLSKEKRVDIKDIKGKNVKGGYYILTSKERGPDYEYFMNGVLMSGNYHFFVLFEFDDLKQVKEITECMESIDFLKIERPVVPGP